MNDTIDIAKVTGQILYQGIDVNRPEINVYEMRNTSEWFSNVQTHLLNQSTATSPLHMNVQELRTRKVLDEIVETSLRQAALWDQVKDDLHKSALTLSGGQQQRLCIARAISVKPDILLNG